MALFNEHRYAILLDLNAYAGSSTLRLRCSIPGDSLDVVGGFSYIRLMYNSKYYSGWLTMRVKGGQSSQMWAVINYGTLMLWKQQADIQ